jgi:O-acetyl-ADP-ribose deacetylase (regulator of RNase III)
MSLTFHVGDICTSRASAIVNAANSQLLAGGGVCGAIFAAARAVNMESTLTKECQAKAPCPTGSAVWTNAYGLNASYIIHAVGPIWHGSKTGKNNLTPQDIVQLGQLGSTYIAIFTVAKQLGISSVAIPSISTGIYGLPAEFGATIAKDICSRYELEFDIELWAYSQAAKDILTDAPTSQVLSLFKANGLLP